MRRSRRRRPTATAGAGHDDEERTLKPTLITSSALAVAVTMTALAPLSSGAEGDPHAIAPTTTAGTTSTGVPATTAPNGTFVVPPGYSPIVDDTGRLTMTVPDTWTDVDTTPFPDNGAEVPRIQAATDIEVWTNSFDAPGALFAGYPFTPDPQTLISRFGLTGGCASTTIVPYDDGVFVGSWGQWTQCGPTAAAEWHLIVASPATQAFTALVIVQLTGPQDQQAFDVVRETFNTTPGATFPPPTATTATTAPGSTAPGSTAATSEVTTTPVPPPSATGATTAPNTAPVTTKPGGTTVSGTTAPGTTAPGTTAPGTTAPGNTVPGSTVPGTTSAGITLIDTTGLLTVVVPSDWVDQDTGFSRHDDGRPRPMLSAAPSLDQFFSGWSTPGVFMVAMPPTTDPTALLGQFGLADSCSDGGIAPHNDGRFVGQLQTWVSCGGTATRVVNLAARPVDNSFTLLVQVLVTTADDAILNQILGSAGTVAGATFQQAGPPPLITPTGQVPPELMPAAPPAGSVVLNADAGRLSVAVPSTFRDIDTSSQLNDDGSDRPRIAAAPVLDDFFAEWTAPGVTVVAYPFNPNPAVILGNLGFAEQCDDGGVQSFVNATFTGLMQTWQNCGDTTTRNVQLALSANDQSATVFVEVQLPDADNTTLATVLSSLQLA